MVASPDRQRHDDERDISHSRRTPHVLQHGMSPNNHPERWRGSARPRHHFLGLPSAPVVNLTRTILTSCFKFLTLSNY